MAPTPQLPHEPDGPDLTVENTHPTLQVDETLLADLMRRIVEAEGFSLRYLGLVLTDHATVLELNRTYLNHDYHTDVLSFPLQDDDETGVVDGEIYVDLDTAAERHGEFGASFAEEVRRYAIHGLLHLMGQDDATSAGREAMQHLEDRYLHSGQQ